MRSLAGSVRLRSSGGDRPLRAAPGVETAVQDRQALAPLSLEQARSGHRPLTMTAVDSEGPSWNGAGRGHNAAKLHMLRPGNVPAGPLACLAHIQGRAVRLLVDLANCNARNGQARRPPGAHAVLKLTGQVLVSDLQALLDEVLPILVRCADENQWPVSLDDPAEPGGEGGTQRNRHGGGDMLAGKIHKRTDVDHDCPRCLVAANFVDRERGEVRCLFTIQTGSALIHSPQTEEVRRVSAEAIEEHPDERILGGRLEQRACLPLSSEGRCVRTVGAGRTERARAMRRVDGQIVRKVSETLMG